MATKEFDYENAMEKQGGNVNVSLYVGGLGVQSRGVAVGNAIAVRGLAEGATVFFASPTQMERVGKALLYLSGNRDLENEGYVALRDMDDWDGTVLEEEPKGWETR